MELTQGEVHLWTIDQDEVVAPEVLAACDAIMTPEERARHRRFKVEHARHEYLVTRGLVRCVLSLYADVAPPDWRFVCNDEGKPEIAAPVSNPGLRFNLSNTAGCILCGVTLNCEIGIDVENTERPGETVRLADRYFSPSEVQALEALPESQQRERFFRYWTLKESYIKARGQGLSIPLEEFAFHLDAGQPIRISFDENHAGGDDPGGWRFWQRPLSERHMAAVAIRQPGPCRGSGRDLEIEPRAFSSLSELPKLLAR